MLRDLQNAIRNAVLSDENGALASAVSAPHGAVAARIDVYRNTVQASLIAVIAAAYPVVRRIVGADYFTMLARKFVISEPPRLPHLATYGGTFPAFLACRANEHRLSYLADVARLEWARTESYFAADSVTLDPSTLAAATEGVDKLRFDLHPAARLVRSAFPIMTIWTANQPENGDVPAIEMTVEETALISRPEMTVITRQISAGDGIFVEKIAAGATLSGAAEAALAHMPSFDLQAALELHLRHGTFATANRAAADEISS